MSVRVRFAPSPTGRLHVGALRTALFDSLFARHHGGANILRIEDTDRSRYSASSEAEFIESLGWAGVEYQEGPHVGGPFAPYRQSERKELGIYAREIERLLEAGGAYWAFDTPEELEQMREFQQINRQPVGYYGGEWRDATSSQVEKARAEGRAGVIRLRMPRGQKIMVDDVIRGRIEWNSDDIDDPVLIKADGMPTYHFAAICDDHLMEISHVIRGEEWISSAPKHAYLFDVMGWTRPIFVHCPVILGPSGKKLSKRDGAASVLDYREQGFLPDALKNFVSLIGWAPKNDQEVMTDAELVEAFDLDGFQPSPGRFDFEKLKWMNGHKIRGLSLAELKHTLLEYARRPETGAYWRALELEEGQPSPVQGDYRKVAPTLAELVTAAEADDVYFEGAVQLEQERVTNLADFGEACAFFFQAEPPFEKKAVEKWFSQAHVRPLLQALRDWLQPLQAVSIADCEAWVRAYAEQQGLEKLGPVVHPLRVSLTGKTVGPGLFELMSLLGPERMIARLSRALEMVA